jgi:ankyrin repeat protein
MTEVKPGMALLAVSAVLVAGCLTLASSRQKERVIIGGIPVSVHSEHYMFESWFVEVVIPADGYSKENLERVWRYYCEKYPDHKDKLDLRVYADSMKRGQDNQGPDALFTRQGEGAAASGGDNEFYTYRPNLGNPKEKQDVQLKGRYPFLRDVYTGEPTLDLVVAAGKGDLPRVEALLAQGVDVKARDDKGRTALMAACRNNELEVAKILLVRGADLNASDVTGATALNEAVSAVVKDPKEEDGWRWGNPEIIRLLLESGAQVNAQEEGWTPLMTAVSHGKDDIVSMLLQRGANVNVRTEIGMTVLASAIYHGRLGMQSIKLLLAAGPDVNAKDNDGFTPLMWAIGKPELVRALIDLGADVNARNKQGETVLAIARGNRDIHCRRLQHAESEWMAQDAAEPCRNHEAVVKMLLSAGAKD